MELFLRVMTEAERKYAYTQSQQIIGQTGCIGHLRADMDSSGTGFYTSWDDHCADLKTDEFKEQFDAVISMLRFDERYGGVLKNRSSLAAYCYAHPDSGFGGDGREFGFRADTQQYAYLMRLNPNRGEYNIYVYCYRRDWLDQHMKRAEKGIRFIDPNYKEQFRIPDGDKIRILRGDGERRDCVCRFIDEYHVEVGGGWDNLFHICQFAEIMERNGNKVIPLRSSLPEKCFSITSAANEMIIITKGEMGYRPAGATAEGKTARESADIVNDMMGVTKAQEAAMLAGSMFGWATPAADPANYDKDGQPIKPKNKNRDHER